MRLTTGNTDMMNRRNQNQTGQTGGEEVKWTRILVRWIKWKIITIKEMTARSAMRFYRHLTYFFSLKKRTYVSLQHIHLFLGDTYVRKKK